ncbi:MAG TPA: alanine racemase [Spirochaetota bacterium]|nr:alanine racemase [Spirochaetota bacterium]
MKEVIMVKRKKIMAAAGCAVLALSLVILLSRPGDRGGGYNGYYAAMNNALKDSGTAQPAIVLDLDRVDSNIARVLKVIAPPLEYRIVTKSLPSPDLLIYVMQKARTKKLMPFHLSHMRAILEAVGPGLDMLPGRPFPVAALAGFYDSLPPSLKKEALKSVQWLVDSQERLGEYRAFAERRGIALRINLEIDVGLHRGGARSNEELGRMLQIIADSSGRLVFSGLMGYDGHVAHVPLYIGSKERAIRKEFAKSMARYEEFVQYGRKAYPALFREDLTFNSGGSKTCALYNRTLPVNDIAAGSCLVMPSTFDVFTLAEHLPALFIAAPVLKILDGYGVPFIESFHSLVEWWDPNKAVTLYVSGGGWSERILAPAGISVNALTASPPNENMLPNQSMLNGSKRVAIKTGDHVFYHPLQGDAVMQFDEIYVIRNGKITAVWKPFTARL